VEWCEGEDSKATALSYAQLHAKRQNQLIILQLLLRTRCISLLARSSRPKRRFLSARDHLTANYVEAK